MRAISCQVKSSQIFYTFRLFQANLVQYYLLKKLTPFLMALRVHKKSLADWESYENGLSQADRKVKP